MLNADQLAVIQSVQVMAENSPIAKRIQLYLGIADFLDRQDAHMKKSFLDRATILEEAQSRCAQLNLKLEC